MKTLEKTIGRYSSPATTEDVNQYAARKIAQHKLNRIGKVELTRSNKTTIQEAIDSLDDVYKMDVIKIVEKVADILIERYGPDDASIEYQLRRVGMQSSLDIVEKVELYLRKYPQNVGYAEN